MLLCAGGWWWGGWSHVWYLGSADSGDGAHCPASHHVTRSGQPNLSSPAQPHQTSPDLSLSLRMSSSDYSHHDLLNSGLVILSHLTWRQYLMTTGGQTEVSELLKIWGQQRSLTISHQPCGDLTVGGDSLACWWLAVPEWLADTELWRSPGHPPPATGEADWATRPPYHHHHHQRYNMGLGLTADIILHSAQHQS